MVGLEASKHTIGNLTIFSPRENRAVANKSYAEKRDVLKNSNLKLNREIGENDTWAEAHVTKRTKALIKMALKIFVP